MFQGLSGGCIGRVDGFKSDETTRVHDWLEKARVTNDRIKGQALNDKNPRWHGRMALMSPTLSYDGKVVYSW